MLLLSEPRERIGSRMSVAALAIGGALVLCTPFAHDSSMAWGIVHAKTAWLHASTVFYAICVLLSLIGIRPEKMSLTVADYLVLAGGVIGLVTYDWMLNPAPEKLWFQGQWIALWLLLRVGLHLRPGLSRFYLVLLLFTALLEVIWGTGQLYGWIESHHTLFRLTGSFFNPGPYSGYLAVCLPLCLGWILRYGRSKSEDRWEKRRLYYFAWICLVAILTILPSGMSRSAWIAAATGCVWVYGMEKNKFRVGKTAGLHILPAVMLVCVVLVAAIAIGAAAYHLKKDSADGRLWIWKVTVSAWKQQPWLGTGTGGFPQAYARAQAARFATGEATHVEKERAGCPEYAFNDYLQTGLEQGMAGLLIWVAWLICVFREGGRRKRYEICGALLALLVFACSSYPFQLSSFRMLLAFLGVLACTGSDAFATFPTEKTFQRPIPASHAGLFTAFLSLAMYVGQAAYPPAYRAWADARRLYEDGRYLQALAIYRATYPELKHQPRFLFEGARAFTETGNPATAVCWLRQAVRLSNDPIMYTAMARNEQAIGQYTAAEEHLREAIELLPARLYPYYLLVKLYADPAFFHPDRLVEAADSVLKKEPLVYNTAIREMREEVARWLEENEALFYTGACQFNFFK